MNPLLGCMTRRSVILTLVCLGACSPDRLVSGDGGSSNNGDLGPLTGTLTVRPAQVNLTAGQGQPTATAHFTVVTQSGQDLTDTAQWSIDNAALGTIVDGTFTASSSLSTGGIINVFARQGNAAGSAVINLKFIAPDETGNGAPAGAAGEFNGPTTGPAPGLVYPLNNAMLAMNIVQMQLAWQAGSGQSLFRVVVDSPTFQRTFYLGCGSPGNGQCSYAVANADWAQLAQSAAGTYATLTLAGTAGAGQPVGTAQPLTVNFSPEAVQGGLYYFSTSAQGLFRVPFGGTQAMQFTSGGECVGCHAVTADGKKVAALFGGGDGAGGIVDGSNAQNVIMQPQSATWNFASFSPDGTKIISVWKGQMSLRDGTTGALISSVSPSLLGESGSTPLVSMPEWSPDGQSIVFVRVPPGEGKMGFQYGELAAGDWILTDSGDIATIPYNNGSFGPSVTLVAHTPGSEYHFYPSFTPDSQWVVFNSATMPCYSPTADENGIDMTGACASYDQSVARLRLVKAQPGSTPIELTAATHLAGRTTAWPKVAPFIQNNGDLVFFTFSSKFAYGWTVGDMVRPQIWMSAIDLSKAASGMGDPSYAPFWLPFQDSTTSNHSTIWTKQIACTQDSDCGAEFSCENGACVPTLG